MSHAPRRFCATPGCGSTVAGRGHCPTHARLRDTGRANAEVRRLYHTTRWRRLRTALLQEEPLCRTCQAGGQVEPATDVDHVQPHDGDLMRFWQWDNLQPLCATCHSRKTQAGA
jgi:5-methylcytosine-specific restriction protein A